MCSILQCPRGLHSRHDVIFKFCQYFLFFLFLFVIYKFLNLHHEASFHINFTSQRMKINIHSILRKNKNLVYRNHKMQQFSRANVTFYYPSSYVKVGTGINPMSPAKVVSNFALFNTCFVKLFSVYFSVYYLCITH